MTFVDHLFVFILFVILPIYSALSQRRYLSQIKTGQPADRNSLYRGTVITQWIALAALMVFWFLLGRPFPDLGFVRPGGNGFYVGVVILILVNGFFVYSWRRAKTMTAKEKLKEVQSLGDLIHFLPSTRQELRSFLTVSLTAGIVEEIVYRGFVIWYLGLVMPLWAAVVFSSILFGLGHSYQGVSGAFKAGLVGLLFGAFYVLTGSIWLPILGHVLWDALQGLSIFEILSRKDSSNPPFEEVASEPGAIV